MIIPCNLKDKAEHKIKGRRTINGHYNYNVKASLDPVNIGRLHQLVVTHKRLTSRSWSSRCSALDQWNLLNWELELHTVVSPGKNHHPTFTMLMFHSAETTCSMASTPLRNPLGWFIPRFQEKKPSDFCFQSFDINNSNRSKYSIFKMFSWIISINEMGTLLTKIESM